MLSQNASTSGHWEPAVARQFLPRCAHCHAPHPMARKPRIESEICPDCGTPSGEPGAIEVQVGSVPGLRGYIGGTLLSIGRGLRNFAKGFDT